MLDTERKFFDENRDSLLQRFPGKFVVIKEDQLLGAYDTIEEALGAGAREFGITSFLVRKTDQKPEEISIPALTLGILRANPSHPTDGAGTDS